MPGAIIVTGTSCGIVATRITEAIPCLASKTRYLHGGNGINH